VIGEVVCDGRVMVAIGGRRLRGCDGRVTVMEGRRRDW
jgi:hypothetical protein